ncbi:hypothetical protein KIW84_070251 [Lathyrus oleraceus]|uniref:Uncharacterized protein n=1 Tax=Pisum sativum TaxID=3888 RepID=A0A9D4VFU4_PEA|nr:hypothetical protein KIW84_070251 [Pisum sativum]
MEETKSIDNADMVLGIFLDSMTTDCTNQVVIDKQVEDNLKKDNKQKKQINKGNNDRKRRRPRNDPIPLSYAYLLPILVNAGAIVPKRIQPAGFPYHPKHDPNATCGYHTGHVGNSIENCNHFKAIVQ